MTLLARHRPVGELRGAALAERAGRRSARRPRRALPLATALSLLLHLGGTGLAVVLLLPAPKDFPGSEGIDVELEAPRLAPPLRRMGQPARDPRAGTHADHRPGVARDRHLAAPSRTVSDRAKERIAAPAARPAASPRAREKRERADSRPTPPAVFQPEELRAREPPLAAALLAELPAGPAPAALLAAVVHEVHERQERHQRALTAQHQREARADRALAALSVARETDDALPGRGSRTPGVRGGSGDRARGQPRRYGLKFYLAGRRVESSRVVVPPEVLSLPPITCRVPRPDIAPATVRMLVDRRGRVGISYLQHSSRSPRFDRCAVRHASAIRFRPGTDEQGAPLAVWINVRVEPSLLSLRVARR